jgi:oxygen-insensitive NAD(P)H nitroreductase
MNFLELATTRYTTKSYQDKRIEKKTIEALKEILRLSPSSINSQPWQFLFVSDEKLKNESLAKLSLMNEQRVKQASHLVIFRVMSPALFEEKGSQYISESGYAFYQRHMKPLGRHMWLLG